MNRSGNGKKMLRVIGIDFGTSSTYMNVKRYDLNRPTADSFNYIPVAFEHGEVEQVPQLHRVAPVEDKACRKAAGANSRADKRDESPRGVAEPRTQAVRVGGHGRSEADVGGAGEPGGRGASVCFARRAKRFDPAEVDGGGAVAAEGFPGGAGFDGEPVETAEVGACPGVEDAEARTGRPAHGGVQGEVDGAVAPDGDEERGVVRHGAGEQFGRVGRDDAAAAGVVEERPGALSATAARGGVQEECRVHGW